ncbi:MAG: hypothetical protein K5829_10065 [Treponema sp.]|nr:hypothetical protein [Treponema sp.]
MDYRISNAAKSASDFITRKACENKFGDITVRVSLKDGVPVKIEKSYCEYFVQRKSERVVEK